MNADVNHMLVYGTLRQGQRAEAMMQRGATYVEVLRLPDALMFHLGGFPGIHLTGGSGIECELYRIDDPRLIDTADRYEGYHAEGDDGNLYHRRTVTTPTGVEAYIYEYNGPPSNHIIESGSWINQ